MHGLRSLEIYWACDQCMAIIHHVLGAKLTPKIDMMLVSQWPSNVLYIYTSHILCKLTEVDVQDKWLMDCIYLALLSKALYIASHSPIHTPTAVPTMQGNNQLVGSSWG